MSTGEPVIHATEFPGSRTGSTEYRKVYDAVIHVGIGSAAPLTSATQKRFGSFAVHPRPSILRTPRSARITCLEAKKVMVPLVRVRERDFRSFLDRHSCQDKYDIAATLTQWFPELAWRLPARPKFYDPEPRSILYFDCIALAIAHLEIANTETMGGKEVFSPASK